MSETLIKVEGVSKKFCRSFKRSLWYGMQDLGRELVALPHGGNGELRKDEFWAVNGVSFELRRGECLGLVGHNGAGKTTLLRMINGLIKPDCGRIEMHGRVGALIALGAGFNPVLTGRENVYVNAAVLGFKRKEIDARLDEIIDFSELADFIDTPVQAYSSGMTVRLGFSIASSLAPDILLLDEVLAVGDSSFRQKCLARVSRLMSDSAVIMVSHDQHSLKRICSKGLLMERGVLKCEGVIERVLDAYAPPQSFFAKSREFKVADRGLDLEWGSSCFERTTSVRYGDPLAVRFRCVAVRELPRCLVVVTFSIAGAHVLQSYAVSDIAQGKSSLSLEVGSVNLADGEYDVSVTIMEQQGRLTLVAWMNFQRVVVRGGSGYGIYYQTPLKVEFGL
jgi:lipopolysaccharide transport system ATP-binding protein